MIKVHASASYRHNKDVTGLLPEWSVNNYRSDQKTYNDVGNSIWSETDEVKSVFLP